MTDEELAAFVDGELQGDALSGAEAHVADCARCREVVAALLGGADDLAVPSERRIGRYVVVAPIGAGAMGVVYTAYDPDLDRKVAVKLLRADHGEGAEETRARLLREAKAMAQISHVNVVAVHDAGTFDDRVFVAMELVPGETLRAWSARQTRSWREVLEIFAQCGRGLAAAHAAGLVHRDFKPDNVLVTPDGRAKVTDFGLARVVLEREEERTATAGVDDPDGPHQAPLVRTATRTGALRGTPAYMAPEQIAGEPADARADQFGFGVALYEALAGTRPFAGRTLDELRVAVLAGHVETARALRDAPSTVRRAIERMLRTKPDDRFPSMDEVVVELERPTRRRPTRWFLAGVACVAAAALFAGRATSSRPAPCAGVAEKASTTWDGATRERVRAAFMATGAPFAADTFHTVDAQLAGFVTGWARQRTLACEATRVRAEQSEELFDLRMRCLDGKLAEATALVDALGTADRELVGSAAQAVVSLSPLDACENGESLRARVKAPASPEARARVDVLTRDLAAARASSELGRYDAARQKLEGVVAGAREVAYAPLAGQALLLHGQVLEHLSRYKESADTLREAAWTSIAAKDEDTTFASSAELVVVLKYRLAQDAEGQLWDRTAAALLDARGKPPRDEALLEQSRGAVDRAQGRYEDARAHTERALLLERRALGDQHLEVAATLTNLGYALSMLARYDDARTALLEAIAIRERALGRDHPLVAQAESRLGMAYVWSSRLDEGLASLQRALAVQEASLGPDHIETGYTLNRIGNVHFARGDFAESLVMFTRVLALGIKVLGPDHPEVGLAHMNLNQPYRELGRRAEAEHEIAEAQRILEASLGKSYAYLATVKSDLGAVRFDEGKLAEAEQLQREALAIAEKALGAEHPELVTPRRRLAEAVLARGRAEEAEKILEDALARCPTAKMLYPDGPATSFALAQALRAAKKDPERARVLADQARLGYRYDSPRDRRVRARIDAWLKT